MASESNHKQYAAPAIKLLYCSRGHADYAPVLCGIEEEGVPWELDSIVGKDAASMAYIASNDSRLGVGLGVDANALALHFDKLEEGRPLFLVPSGASDEQLRCLGANAARLVKRLPFKPL